MIQEYCRRATLSVPKDRFPAEVGELSGFIKERTDRIEIRTENVNALIEQLLEMGVDMSRVDIQTPTLEDVFLKLTGRSLRE